VVTVVTKTAEGKIPAKNTLEASAAKTLLIISVIRIFEAFRKIASTCSS
jgi:hypothetical protein